MGTVAQSVDALCRWKGKKRGGGVCSKIDRSSGALSAPPGDPVAHNKTMCTYVRVW